MLHSWGNWVFISVSFWPSHLGAPGLKLGGNAKEHINIRRMPNETLAFLLWKKKAKYNIHVTSASSIASDKMCCCQGKTNPLLLHKLFVCGYLYYLNIEKLIPFLALKVWPKILLQCYHLGKYSGKKKTLCQGFETETQLFSGVLYAVVRFTFGGLLEIQQGSIATLHSHSGERGY